MIPKFEIKLPNGLILSVEGDPNRSWKVKPESESQLALKMAEAIATADWPAVVSLYGSKTAKSQAALEVSREQAAQVTASKPRQRAVMPPLNLNNPIAPSQQQERAIQVPAPTQPSELAADVPVSRASARRQTSLRAVTDLLSGAPQQEKTA